jgi:tetratricopeptide (TPR) repeat protein
MTKMRSFGLLLGFFLGFKFSIGFGQTEALRYKSALEALNEHRLEAAKKEFYQLISQYPKNAEYWYWSGVTKTQLKDYSSALVDLNKSISLNAQLKDAYLFRHLANKETRNFQFALADISKYLEFYPNDTSARWSRYSLAIHMREFEEALNDGKWLIDKELGNDSLLEAQLHLLEETANYRHAIELLTQIIKKDAQNEKWYYKRAHMYYGAADHQKSLNDIERFLIVDPKNPSALKLRFDNHFYMRNLPTCEKYIIELIELDAKNGIYHGDYGHVLLQKGDWSNAEKSFDKAIKLKSDALGYIYLGRGIARFNKGQRSEACADWERALLLGEMVSRNYLVKYCNK